jgi:putative acetyltransferase
MLKIYRTTSNNKDFKNLLDDLNNDLRARYSNNEYKFDVDIKIDTLETVALASINDIVLGCGCFKEIKEDTVEIKRMFVNPYFRGYGVASAILEELTSWAKELYYSWAVLETGEQQPESIKLYSRHGFEIIDNFGPYVGLRGSVCMGKRL